MVGGRSTRLWIINILSFLLLCGLGFTGLVNWLVLPRGPARGGFLFSLRHFSVGLHEWLGVFFLLVIVFHLYLHRDYLKRRLATLKGDD